MVEITAKAIMEKLDHIEQIVNDETDGERQAQLLRESEIRQQMRVDHARQMLDLGTDAETISKVTGLRTDFVEQLRTKSPEAE